MLWVQVLGELVVKVAGTSLPAIHAHGPRVLLAWLALHPGRHSRATVAAELWPGFVDASARNSLRTALSALRRQLGPDGADCVVASREAIGLADDGVTVDLAEFERCRQRGEHELAIELCRGELLSGLEDGWALAARQQHVERVDEILDQLARGAEQRSDRDGAIRWARQRAALDPLGEEALRELMRLLAANGQRAEALTMYGRLRERLRRELAMAPSVATRQLAGELRRHRTITRDVAYLREPLSLPPRLRARQRSTFVDRAGELERLRRAWQRAEAGERGLVLVAGEPGIGKSRLCAELAGSVQGASVLYGGCLEEGGGPYHVFVEALRPLVAALPPLVIERVGAPLSGLLPELASDAPTGDGEPREDPQAARQHLFSAVADAFATACASHPVLLVLEDLHWADPATLLMLEHTVRASAGSPLLVVGSYREDALATAPRLAATLAELRREVPYELLPLTGLQPPDTQLLVAGWLGEAPSKAFVESVQERTDGNPFFIEEFLRDLVEASDGAALEQRVGVPEPLRAVIAQRVARLSEACQRVLSAAAVIGREFDTAMLEAIGGLDEETLDAAVEEALASHLILERPGGYLFKHALIRDALYERLSSRRRNRLHLRVADAIEALPELERLGRTAELAAHLRMAPALVEPRRAIAHSVAAGRSAARLLAWEEADDHWHGALALIESHGAPPGEEARLRARLGDLMYVTGFDLERAIEYLEQALRLYDEAGDVIGAAEVRWRLGRSYATFWGPTMDIPRALEHLEVVERTLADSSGRRRAYVLIALSAVAIWQARTADALALSEEALQIARRLDDQGLWANAAALHGTALWHRGEVRASDDLLERAWETADRLNLAWVAFLITYVEASKHFWLLDPVRVGAASERELSQPRQAHAPGPRRWMLNIRAHGLVIQGDLDDARLLLGDVTMTGFPQIEAQLELRGGDLSRALALWAAVRDRSRTGGDRITEAAACLHLGIGHRLAGDRPAAARSLGEGLRAVGSQHAGMELLLRAEAGTVAVCEGRGQDAAAELARCREVMALGEPWRGIAGRVALSGAAVAAGDGRLAEAEDGFRRASELFREYRLPFDAAEALHQWGRTLAAAGRPDASDRFDEAIELQLRHQAPAQWRETILADRARLPRG